MKLIFVNIPTRHLPRLYGPKDIRTTAGVLALYYFRIYYTQKSRYKILKDIKVLKDINIMNLYPKKRPEKPNVYLPVEKSSV